TRHDAPGRRRAGPTVQGCGLASRYTGGVVARVGDFTQIFTFFSGLAYDLTNEKERLMAVIEWRGVSARTVALIAIGALMASVAVVASPRIAGADTYPGVDEIAAAKAAVGDQTATV